MGYNVIWIDDEWDTRGTSFIQTCKLRHQIYISPYKTRKEGIAALESNLKYWDAVILDAKAYNNSENEVADLDGMYAARERLIELRQQRHIPCFVLTGQPDLMGDKSFEKAVGKFYDKKKPEEVNQLISDLKEEVSKSNRFQLKSIYHDAVEQLSDISIEACEDVIDILEAMHHPELPFNPKLHFNPLRQALECVFRSANKVGIIPDLFFIDDRVNINQCFMYLIGCDAKNVGVRCCERIAPYHIQNMMSMIVNLGNANSHSKLSESEIQTAEDKIIKDGMSSRYLVFSMALQLCEIAFWMNRYVSEHPDKDDNLKKCISLESEEKVEKKEMIDDSEVIGLLEEHEGICHMGAKFSVLLKHKEWLGKKIRVINYVDNTNTKTKQYPYFVREQDFELIEDPENGSK
jgi:hypothetical protein